MEAGAGSGSSIRPHGLFGRCDDRMGRLNANVVVKFDWVSGLARGLCLNAPRRILEFLKMNAKYKMSLLLKRCWSDSASCMSSLLLYNYLLTFTDSDSCESLKKDARILPLCSCLETGPKIHLALIEELK